MKFFRVLIAIITVLALVVTYVFAGLAVCAFTPLTHAIASGCADDATSPFDRTQLVKVADATREYSFGNHSELQLYKAIYDVDFDYRQSIYANGGSAPAGFPNLDSVTDLSNPQQLKAAFNGASEVYCYTDDVMSHLNDCYDVMVFAFPFAIAGVAVAIIGLVFTGVTGRKKWVAGVLTAPTIIIFVLLLALLGWGLADWNGFFAAFHQVFFSQGNWEFPYNSLLICALPNKFWMLMAIVWVITTVMICVVSALIAGKLRSEKRKKS